MSGRSYEQDFYGWTQEQALLLRTKQLSELDAEHLAEELESMGRSERRELESRLSILLTHLLKWEYQAGLRSRSWTATIAEQRRQIGRHLVRNPSLQASLDEVFISAYDDARYTAGLETGYTEVAFPAGCPYTLEEVLQPGFMPE